MVAGRAAIGLRFFVRITRNDTGEVPLNPDGLCDDQRTVYVIWSKRADAREDERGLTPAGIADHHRHFGNPDSHSCDQKVLTNTRAAGRRVRPRRPAFSGQVNDHSQTLATQVALRNRMR